MRSCHSRMMRACKAVTSEGIPGNFLLRLLVEAGDLVLKENLSSAPNNSKYQSPSYNSK